MKKSSDIVYHLICSPTFTKFRKKYAAKMFIEELPKSLKDGIKFVYIKEKTLYIALKHSSHKQEFFHKIKLVKSCLKTFQKEKDLLKQIEDIKYFESITPYDREVKRIAEQKEQESYGELSNGEFKNLATTKEVRAVFEEIREIILRNKD